MRMVIVAGLGLGALAATVGIAGTGGLACLRSGTAAAGPRPVPPPAVQRAAAPLGCDSLAWSAWSGGWWADCARTETAPRNERVTTHRYLAFHRQRDGQFAMETIAETRAGDSPRIKSPRFEKVTQRDGRAVYEAHTEFGYVHRQVWNLFTTPATLVEEREGGEKICQEGISNYTSDIVRPLCETDYAQRRQSCTVQQPDCRQDPVKVAAMRYTAIPLHDAAAPLRDPDLFRCATEIGGHSDDVISGKNVGHAKFQAVAVDDAAAKTLALHLRAFDATPQPVTGDDWPVHDHWELWLANQHSELACDDTANLADFCQRTQASLAVVQVILAPRADGTIKLLAATPLPPAAWSSDVHARTDGKDLIVELSGALRDWARDGGLTLVYSDSPNGTKPGSQLATSPVRLDHCETFGRLGDTHLCDRAEPAKRP